MGFKLTAFFGSCHRAVLYGCCCGCWQKNRNLTFTVTLLVALYIHKIKDEIAIPPFFCCTRSSSGSIPASFCFATLFFVHFLSSDIHLHTTQHLFYIVMEWRAMLKSWQAQNLYFCPNAVELYFLLNFNTHKVWIAQNFEKVFFWYSMVNLFCSSFIELLQFLTTKMIVPLQL